MKIIDVNILLYAINEDLPQHPRVLRWWEAALNDDETVGLPLIVILGFLRISTHSSIFPRPLPADESIDRVNTWLERPNVCIVREKAEQWGILKSLLQETGTAGNLTTDAFLATLAIVHGAELISCDNDFKRFQGLRWKNPLQASI